MEELRVGMFARYDGRIGKVKSICTCEQCKARGYYEPTIEYIHNEVDYVSCYFKDNLKVSENIIDLIEIGDYVNGLKVTKINVKAPITNNKAIECKQEDLSNGYEGITFVYDNWDIKSIVTKEQMESVGYKVGE